MVQYSPLCDTSILAYFAYLISSNGELSVGNSGVGGSSGGGSSGNGGGYVGGDVVRLFLAFCDKNKANEGVLGSNIDNSRAFRAFIGDVVDETQSHKVVDAGFSGHSDGGDIRGLVGGGSDGCGDGSVCAGGAAELPDGEVSLDGELGERARGKNWRRNQKKRAKRAGNGQKVEVAVSSGSSEEVRGAGFSSFLEKPKDALRLSLEEKWRVENELKIARAKRELDLLQSEDREAVKKLRDRKVQGATERTMVQIEKAHASLVQTGNVPGVQPGFCQTVVDGEVVESVPGLSSGESKECSISPSSSISEREVRNMMKELEDLKEKVRKYERKEGLEERVGKMYAESVPVTLDSEECVPEDIKELAADRFEGPEFFKYGKVFEKDNKKYRTMRFDAEGYSYSGRENWYG